jgi:LPS export ABC transporter protein LptC
VFASAGLLLIALAAVLGLAACQRRLAEDLSTPPFLFRALNLRQQDPQGRPAWQLTSPEARYDLARKVAQARELRGTIYASGRPLYRLSASSGIVLNDGALIQLEGQATLERLGSQPLVIRARRVRWFTRQQRMELDLRPRARDRDLEVSADRAVFRIDRDKLELRGNPEIRRQPTSSASPGQPGAAVLKVHRIDWYPTSGVLSAPGPVRAVRAQAAGKPSQTLTAAFLRGNSRRQELLLQAPVRFLDPAAGAQLQAGDTWIDLARQALYSRQPFSGSIRRLQLSGEGFAVVNAGTLAVITPGCRLRQPGEALAAQRCAWNWSTQAIQASGGVELRRQANQQVTRASRLDGRLGADGLVVFSSPGSRVSTELRVPVRPPGDRSARPQAGRAPVGL